MIKRHRVTFDSGVLADALRVAAVGFAATLAWVPFGARAASEHSLTDLAYTAGFQGNWEVFSKFNWVGALLSTIISVACLLGLFMMMVRMIATLLYLSNKNIFNRVHEIKTAGKGNGFFGMQQVGRDLWQGNLGSGMDAVVGFLLSLAPDVVEYSDYADGGVSYNLADTDTVTQWFMKVSLGYIMTIFFYSAGWNGVLFQAWAVVSDSMGVAAQQFVHSNLETYVDRLLNTGSAYSFGFSATGTEFGKFQQKIAKELYAKAQKQCVDLSTQNRIAIGDAVDKQIKEITATKVAGMGIGSSVDKNDLDAKNLQYQVIMNTQAKYDKTNVVSIPASALGLGNANGSTDKYHFHVFITKKANANETNYFQVQKKNSTGNTGTGNFTNPNQNLGTDPDSNP